MDLNRCRLSGSPGRREDLSEWAGSRKMQTNAGVVRPKTASCSRFFRTPAWERLWFLPAIRELPLRPDNFAGSDAG